MKTLSIVIPAYNEEAFIGKLLQVVGDVATDDLGFVKEIIVVDDGSRDRTAEIARTFANVTVLSQPNQGKGRAVQNGIRAATGDFVLVQDADLEYDPADYRPMLQALLDAGDRKVAVYGSRTLGALRQADAPPLTPGRVQGQDLGPWLANVALSCVAFGLYGKLITDTLTAYKLYPTEILRSFEIVTHGFETDHEITARLIRAGVRIVEVPVGYRPRSLSEGKKIRMRDGFVAVWTFARFRVS